MMGSKWICLSFTISVPCGLQPAALSQDKAAVAVHYLGSFRLTSTNQLTTFTSHYRIKNKSPTNLAQVSMRAPSAAVVPPWE
uniref:Lipocalin n=1 Tax=Rhipicephalus appendiculatus TaxID=34631 RepID=A0A131YQW9_RHIAP